MSVDLNELLKLAQTLAGSLSPEAESAPPQACPQECEGTDEVGDISTPRIDPPTVDDCPLD